MMDKDKLLAARLGQTELEIDGVGTIRVRALSRAQVLYLRTLRDNEEEMERECLRLGVADPSLTKDEVVRWQESATSDEMATVLQAIRDISGLSEGATKRGVSGVRTEG